MARRTARLRARVRFHDIRQLLTPAAISRQHWRKDARLPAPRPILCFKLGHSTAIFDYDGLIEATDISLSDAIDMIFPLRPFATYAARAVLRRHWHGAMPLIRCAPSAAHNVPHKRQETYARLAYARFISSLAGRYTEAA